MATRDDEPNLVDESLFGMPVREFLDAFLPMECTAKFRRNVFRDSRMFSRQGEGSKVHSTLVQTLSNLMQGFVVRDFSAGPSTGATVDNDWVPHIVAFQPESLTAGNSGDLSDAELCHHVVSTDIRVDLLAEFATEEDDDDDNDDEVEAMSVILSHVASSLLEILNLQHRTHVFHVLIGPNFARLLRLDSAGMVVSESIPICQDSMGLQEFYWRYCHASPEARGHDPTVRKATPEEVAMALPALKALGREETETFFVFEVPNPVSTTKTEDGASTATSHPEHLPLQSTSFRNVVASLPMASLDDLTGRWTKAYAAFDLERREIVFLKDSWRDDDDDHEPEARTLRKLNEHNVEHVPTLFAGDDVPGRFQRTRTDHYARADWEQVHNGNIRLDSRVHHRLLEDFLPQSVSEFKTPRTMMQCIYDGLIAHQQAYERCGILHRDISANNVRIREGGEGVLSDWDHAITLKHPDEDDIIREPCRQGTWRFLSSTLSVDVDKPHSLDDDLESILWVVLYTSLSTLPFKTTKGSSFQKIQKQIFDDKRATVQGPMGGRKKTLVLAGKSLTEGLSFTEDEPLTRWFHSARVPFRQLGLYNAHQRRVRSAPESSAALDAPAFPESLSNHDFLVALTAKYLEETEVPERRLLAKTECSSPFPPSLRLSNPNPNPLMPTVRKRLRADDEFEPPSKKRSVSPVNPQASGSQEPGRVVKPLQRESSAKAHCFSPIITRTSSCNDEVKIKEEPKGEKEDERMLAAKAGAQIQPTIWLGRPSPRPRASVSLQDTKSRLGARHLPLRAPEPLPKDLLAPVDQRRRVTRSSAHTHDPSGSVLPQVGALERRELDKGRSSKN